MERRALVAGLSGRICRRTHRATGVTAYLEPAGTVEKAPQVAAHEVPKTTKLYDRTSDRMTLDDVDRIAISLARSAVRPSEPDRSTRPSRFLAFSAPNCCNIMNRFRLSIVFSIFMMFFAFAIAFDRIASARTKSRLGPGPPIFAGILFALSMAWVFEDFKAAWCVLPISIIITFGYKNTIYCSYCNNTVFRRNSSTPILDCNRCGNKFYVQRGQS